MKTGRLAVGTQNFPFSICHLSFVIGRRTKRIQNEKFQMKNDIWKVITLPIAY